MTPQVAALVSMAEYQARSLEFFSLKYAFVLDALLASVLVGATCGALGVFLVLRRLSMLGDAAGHAALPGLCGAFIVTGSLAPGGLLIGALASCLASTVCVGLISRGARARPDAAIGIVLSVFFGAGVVLLSWIQRHAVTQYAGLDAMLLGNAAGIERGQLYWIAALSGAVLLGLALAWRPLALASFDPGFARVAGVPVRALHYGLLCALALCVILSVQAVGVILVSAMLIIPACAALALSTRLASCVMIACGIGVLSGVLGAWASYIQEGLATGPAMVLIATGFFAAATLYGQLRRRRRAGAPGQGA